MKPTNRIFLSAITVAAATILLFMLPALAAQAQAPIQSGVLSAAPFHTCALKADGNVTCWGQDAWGVLDAPAGPFTQVTANQYHGCGLLEDGFVDCWGGIPPDPNDPRYWYMLYDQTDPPRAIFTQISAGDVHNCGLEPPGSVRCWGSVRSGQAGLHTGPYTQVTAGMHHSCALTASGTADCWGAQPYRNPLTMEMVYVDWGQAADQPGPYTQLSAGYYHTCGLRPDGSADCWGLDGAAVDSAGPYVRISAGYGHACGLTSGGAVNCWGFNNYGQSGYHAGPYVEVSAGGNRTCARTPAGAIECWGVNDGAWAGPYGPYVPQLPETTLTSAPANPSVVNVASFTFTTNETRATFECRLDDAEFAACTSPQAYAELAQGGHTFEVRTKDLGGNYDLTPAAHTWTIDSITPDTTLSANPAGATYGYIAFSLSSDEAGVTFQCKLDGGSYAACTSPQVYHAYAGLAAGSHTFTVRARDAAGNIDATPATYAWTDNGPYPRAETSVSAGFEHSCALRTDASAACWGDGFYGQDADMPGPFTQVTTGTYHTCGLRNDGSIDCWGSNGYGQAPAHLAGPYFQVSAGDSHTCALRVDGSIDCWGDGQFNQIYPHAGPFLQVDAGGYHTCALRWDRTIDCWGAGDSVTNDWPHLGQSIPETGFVFTQVSAGKHHTCGLTTDGAARCWGATDGDYAYGQSADQAGPYLQVTAGYSHTCGRTTNAVDCWGVEANATDQPYAYTVASAGDSHTCAMIANGAVDCWGYNNAGQATDQPWLDTFIDSHPASPEASSSATFTFHSDLATAAFECSLDDGVFVPCTSPATYESLSPGSHTFRVRGLNGIVADPTPAEWTWTADWRVAQTIAFDALVDKIYGDPPFTASATASSGLPVSFSAQGACSVAGSTVTITGAGSCTVTAQQAGTADYLPAEDVARTFAIAPKAASVSPTPAGKTYGDADPTLAGTLEGFLAVDGVTAAFSRTPGEDAGGDYTISASLSPEARLANYAITYNTAAFTIALRPIEVTADAASKYVGDADPPLTHRITSGSLAAGDALTGALSREPGEAVGVYAILQGDLSAGANYDLAYIGAQLTIANRTANVTLGGLRQMYDGAPKTVTVTTDPAGLAVTVTYDGSETAPSAAGAYAVVATVVEPGYEGSASGEFLIASILYTTPGGLASGVCDTWAAACTLQHALDTVAQNGDEIWVQAGTYHGGFDLRSGIRVYGGFAGGELSRNDRNWRTNATILSGSVPGQSDERFWHQHVVTFVDAGPTTVLDGFTIRDGRALADCGMGAGIHSANSSPQLANLLVTGNQASCDGGGLYATGGSLTLANVTIDANSSERYGGGVYAVDTTLRLVNAVVKRNSMAAAGGGIYAHRTSLQVLNATVAYNYATTGSELGWGLALGYASSAVIRNSIFVGNGASAEAEVYAPYEHTVTISYGMTAGGCPPRTACDHAVTGVPQWVQPPADLRLASGSPGVDAGNNAYVPPDEMDVDGDGDTAEPVPVDPNGAPRFFDDPVADTGSGTPPIVDLGAFETAPIPASVTLADLGQTYDGQPRPVAVTTQPAGLAVSVTYDGAVEPPAAAGSYAVVAVISDPGYSGSAYSTLVIAPKATSVSPTPAGKTYGDADPTLDGTLAGFVPADGVTAAYSRTPGENVGEYVISATLHPEAALANYDITCNTATFTIGPRKITVTADAQAKFVGDADPELTYQLTGGSLIGMDPLTGSLSRAPGEDAGTYPITQGTLTAGSNYALTYIGAALTIRLNDTSTELSASTLAARLDEPVTFTAVVSAGGEPVSGGTVTFRDGEMTLGASVLAGGQAQLTLSTLGLGEHAITAVYGGDGGWAGSTSDPVIVTVAKKAATVTIGGLEQTYDGQPKPVTVTTSPAGLTVAITYAGSAAAPVAAGEYVVSAAILSASYEGSTSGILLISPRPASVAAHEKTKVYGAANPALTATVEGVVAGDTIAHSLATTAEALSGVGDYRIIVSLGDNPNYDVTPLDGVLSITPKAATVTAHDTSKVYGEEVPPLTAAVEGQVEGGASIVYLLSTTAEKTSDVGDYDITVKLGANPNYTVTATGATLHINKGQSTVSLTARAATVLLDKPVIFDATAAAVAPASGTPTGWLDFYEGETLLMTKVALVGGVAELKLSNLSSGPHAIQAKYSGDDNWLGDGSEVVSVFIANPGFTMSLACAATEPVPQEGPALFKATFANTGNIELLITAGGGIGSFALAPGASTGFTVSLPGDYSGQSAVEASVGASSVYIDDAGNRWSGETSGTAACAVACRVSLLKWTNGAVDPTKGWIFSVWDGADGFGGTRLATATTLDNADGLLDFGNLALDSGKAYTLCEENIPAGWTFFWQVDTDDDGAVDTALIPYNPNADDLDPDTGEPAPGDEGNRCVDFGAVTGVDLMTTGGTLHFLVNDTYPGGEPRPADYWKNWNRCTDGGQAATADANGGWQEGYWLLEDVLDPAIGGGITWDDILADSVLFPITRCAVAVDLLDQRSLGDPAVVYDGIKHAEDAAYGLAKELLAAQLNLGAAARTCTEATDAVLNGEKLLDKYNFVAGDGAAYLVATNKKTKADYNLALSLAATLAEYNNGLLCTGVEPPVVTITSPAGPTVSGDSVTVVAGVISAAGVVQVAFLVDGVLIGTDTDAADGWSMAWSLVGVADKAYTLTVTATDTLDQAGSATINVTVDNEADPTIKVAVLTPDSRWTKVGVTWEATIAVQVEPALAGAVVSGSWSTGVTASCTTAADGTCTVVLPNISKKVASVTFTVSNVALSGYVYDPSGATAVTVTKP